MLNGIMLNVIMLSVVACMRALPNQLDTGSMILSPIPCIASAASAGKENIKTFARPVANIIKLFGNNFRH